MELLSPSSLKGRHISWVSKHSVFAKPIAGILDFKSRGRLGRVGSVTNYKGVGIVQHGSSTLYITFLHSHAPRKCLLCGLLVPQFFLPWSPGTSLYFWPGDMEP